MYFKLKFFFRPLSNPTDDRAIMKNQEIRVTTDSEIFLDDQFEFTGGI